VWIYRNYFSFRGTLFQYPTGFLLVSLDPSVRRTVESRQVLKCEIEIRAIGELFTVTRMQLAPGAKAAVTDCLVENLKLVVIQAYIVSHCNLYA